MHLRLAPAGRAALLKIAGSVESGDSVSLFSFLEANVFGRYKNLIIDLGECDNPDSTFMGTILVTYERQKEGNGAMCLINVKGSVRRSMELLGLLELLPTKDACVVPEVDFVDVDIPDTSGDIDEKVRVMRIAHKALAALNRRNEEQFGPFLRLLDMEMPDER